MQCRTVILRLTAGILLLSLLFTWTQPALAATSLERGMTELVAWTKVDRLWDASNEEQTSKTKQIASTLAAQLDDLQNSCTNWQYDWLPWKDRDLIVCKDLTLAVDTTQKKLNQQGVIFAYDVKSNFLGYFYVEKASKGEKFKGFKYYLNIKDAAKAAKEVAQGQFKESKFFHFETDSALLATEYDKAINQRPPVDPTLTNTVYRLWDENDKENVQLAQKGIANVLVLLKRYYDIERCNSYWSASGRCSVVERQYFDLREFLRFRGVLLQPESIKQFSQDTYGEQLQSMLEYVTNPTRVQLTEKTDTELRKLLDEAIKQNEPSSPDVRTYGFLGGKVNDRNKDEKYHAGLLERSLADLINGISNWVFGLFDMQDVVTLVFGKNPTATVLDEGDHLTVDCPTNDCRADKVFGIFDTGTYKVVGLLYETANSYTPIIFVITLMAIGFYIAFRGSDTQAKANMKDYVYGFVLGLLALVYGRYLWDIVFSIDYLITDFIWALLQDNGVYVDKFLTMIWGNMGYADFTSNRTIATAVIGLASSIMTATLNYQYALRFIMFIFLFGFFPWVCATATFPRFRNSLNLWWAEFRANVFVDAAHSIALGIFFLLMRFAPNLSVFVFIAYFLGLGTIVSVIRKFFGLNTKVTNIGGPMGSMVNSFASFAGIGSLLSMRDMAMGKPASHKGLDAFGGDGSLVPKDEGGMLAKIGRSGVLGSVLSGIGQFTGSLASAALTGNPRAGASLGGNLGRLTSGLVGSSAKNIDDTLRAMNHEKGMFAGMEEQYLSGKGGALNTAAVQMGWGAQRFLDMLRNDSSGMGARRGRTIADYKDQYRSSTDEMHQLHPQLESARAEFHSQKSQFGKGSEWFQNNTSYDVKKQYPEFPQDYVTAQEKVKETQANLAVARREGSKHEIEVAEKEHRAAQNNFSEMDGRYGRGSAWFNQNTTIETVAVAPEMPQSYIEAEQNYNKLNARYEAAKSKAIDSKHALTNREYLYQQVNKMKSDDTFSVNPFRGTYL